MHKIIVDGIFIAPRDKLNTSADIMLDFTIIDLFREVYPWLDDVIHPRYIIDDDYNTLKQRLKLRYFNLLGDDWRECFRKDKFEEYLELLKQQGPMEDSNSLLFAKITKRLKIRMPMYSFVNSPGYYPFGHRLGKVLEQKCMPVSPLYPIEGSFSYVNDCRAPDFVWDTGLCMVPVDVKVNMKFSDPEQVSALNFVKLLMGQSPVFRQMTN